MSLKSRQVLVQISGIMVFGIGTFLLFLGVAYSQAGFCYGMGPCMHQGLLGIADFLVYNFGLNPTSMGVLLAAIGLSITVIGLRGGRSGYLQGAGVLTFVASLLTFVLMVGGVVEVFGAVQGNRYCGSGPCDLPSLIILAAFGTAGFAMGVAASVASMMGRYHVIEPLGIGILMSSGLVALIINVSTFASFMAPVVSLCMQSALFTILGRGGVFIRTGAPRVQSEVDRA